MGSSWAAVLFCHTTALQWIEFTRRIRVTDMLQVWICQWGRFHRKLVSLGESKNTRLAEEVDASSQVPGPMSLLHQPFVHDHCSDRRRGAVVGKIRGRIFSQEQDRSALSNYLRSSDSLATVVGVHG